MSGLPADDLVLGRPGGTPGLQEETRLWEPRRGTKTDVFPTVALILLRSEQIFEVSIISDRQKQTKPSDLFWLVGGGSSLEGGPSGALWGTPQKQLINKQRPHSDQVIIFRRSDLFLLCYRLVQPFHINISSFFPRRSQLPRWRRRFLAFWLFGFLLLPAAV